MTELMHLLLSLLQDSIAVDAAWINEDANGVLTFYSKGLFMCLITAVHQNMFSFFSEGGPNKSSINKNVISYKVLVSCLQLGKALLLAGGEAVAGCEELVLQDWVSDEVKVDLGLSLLGWLLPKAQLESELKDLLVNLLDFYLKREDLFVQFSKNLDKKIYKTGQLQTSNKDMHY